MEVQARTLLRWLLPLALLGCSSEVDPTNPYDPQTPASQQAAGTVSGRVALPEDFGAGRLVGGRVALVAAEEALGEVELSESGAYRFEAVVAGPYLVRVSVEGFEAASYPFELAAGQALSLPLFELHPLEGGRGRIEGRVELVGATAHGGVRVAAEETPYSAESGADGGFVLEAPPGTYDLWFTRQGYAPRSVEGVVVSADEVTRLPEALRLTGAPATLRGTVSLGGGLEDPEALRQVRLELRPFDAVEGEATSIAEVAADGFYQLEVAEGVWQVRASLVGFQTVEQRVVLGPGGSATQDLVLEPDPPEAQGSLRGVARLSGAAEGGHAGILVEVLGRPWRTETDSEGSWSVSAAAGRHDLRFSRPGYGATEVSDQEVLSGETTELPEVVLSADPGRIVGAVRLAGEAFDDARLIEVALTLTPIDAPEDARVESPTAEGSFAFEGLAPGDYVLRGALLGFASVERDAQVPPGGTVNLGVVALAPGAGHVLRGRALKECPGECDHAGIRVESLRTPFLTQTGSEGDFRLALNAGRHTLRFSLPGYGEETRDLEVEGGALELEGPVVLSLAASSVRGVALRRHPEGAEVPAAGARIELRAGEALLAEGSALAGGTSSSPCGCRRGPTPRT